MTDSNYTEYTCQPYRTKSNNIIHQGLCLCLKPIFTRNEQQLTRRQNRRNNILPIMRDRQLPHPPRPSIRIQIHNPRPPTTPLPAHFPNPLNRALTPRPIPGHSFRRRRRSRFTRFIVANNNHILPPHTRRSPRCSFPSGFFRREPSRKPARHFSAYR